MIEKGEFIERRLQAYRQKLSERIESFPRGRFYDDVVVGSVIEHAAVAHITEEDNELFCMLTENQQPIHTDHDMAIRMGFDEVVVNGLYGLSMIVGLSVDEETTDGTLKLNLGYEHVRQSKPLRLGDIVTAQTVYTDKRMSEKYAPDLGIVTMQITGFRQGLQETQREQFLTLERSGLVYTKIGFQKIASQWGF